MDYNKIIIALVVLLVVMIAAGAIFLNPGHAKIDSRVIVTSNSTMHDGDNFTVMLTDLNNTPIANQRVNITIIDANGGKNPQVVTTDAKGEGSLQLNGLNPGNYTMNVTYGGNENYTSCNTTQNLEMKKVETQSKVEYTSEITCDICETYAACSSWFSLSIWIILIPSASYILEARSRAAGFERCESQIMQACP